MLLLRGLLDKKNTTIISSPDNTFNLPLFFGLSLTKPYNFCKSIHFCQGLKQHHRLKQDELDTSDLSLVLVNSYSPYCTWYNRKTEYYSWNQKMVCNFVHLPSTVMVDSIFYFFFHLFDMISYVIVCDFLDI